MIKKISIVTGLIFLLGLSSMSQAFPNPQGIKWKGSSTEFVRSLYHNVYGRSPENGNVVASHANSIKTPASRLKKFHAFLRTREFANAHAFGTRGPFTLWRNICNRGNAYGVGVTPPGGQGNAQWVADKSNLSWSYAVALMGYHKAYPIKRKNNCGR